MIWGQRFDCGPPVPAGIMEQQDLSAALAHLFDDLIYNSLRVHERPVITVNIEVCMQVAQPRRRRDQLRRPVQVLKGWPERVGCAKQDGVDAELGLEDALDRVELELYSLVAALKHVLVREGVIPDVMALSIH